jgi:hypothetical protein
MGLRALTVVALAASVVASQAAAATREIAYSTGPEAGALMFKGGKLVSVDMFIAQQRCNDGKRRPGRVLWRRDEQTPGDRSTFRLRGSRLTWTFIAPPHENGFRYMIQARVESEGRRISGSLMSSSRPLGTGEVCTSPTRRFTAWLTGPLDFAGKTSQGKSLSFFAEWQVSRSGAPTRVVVDSLEGGIEVDLACPDNSGNPFFAPIGGTFDGAQFTTTDSGLQTAVRLPAFGAVSGTATGTITQVAADPNGCRLDSPVTFSAPLKHLALP